MRLLPMAPANTMDVTLFTAGASGSWRIDGRRDSDYWERIRRLLQWRLRWDDDHEGVQRIAITRKRASWSRRDDEGHRHRGRGRKLDYLYVLLPTLFSFAEVLTTTARSTSLAPLIFLNNDGCNWEKHSLVCLLFLHHGTASKFLDSSASAVAFNTASRQRVCIWHRLCCYGKISLCTALLSWSRRRLEVNDQPQTRLPT